MLLGDEEEEEEGKGGKKQEWVVARTCRASEELIQDNRDGIEPVQRLMLPTTRDTLVIISLTEIPKPDTVKVMQTNRLGNRVDERGVGHRCRKDVG